MEFIFSVVVFGIFVVAAFKIVYQYSVVRGVLSLAEDHEVSKHLPLATASKHPHFVERAREMLLHYWAIWYPLVVVSGVTYGWFTMMLFMSKADWSLSVIAFITISFASAIMKGLISPFPPEWFADWGYDLALTKNQLLIKRVEANIAAVQRDTTAPDTVREFAIENFNEILKVLKEERAIILDMRKVD